MTGFGRRNRVYGFTLIELLAALLVLALLALMSYRGLSAVLQAREHVTAEAQKWRRAESFFARFERDVQLAAPRSARVLSSIAPAWLGSPPVAQQPLLQFSRFASMGGIDSARRLGYGLNDKQEIELWLWPGLDVAPGAVPARYPVLAGVQQFELQYLDARLSWVGSWPQVANDPALPRAVRVRILLRSGEELVRVFALQS